jgi:hypothetical protein
MSVLKRCVKNFNHILLKFHHHSYVSIIKYVPYKTEYFKYLHVQRKRRVGKCNSRSLRNTVLGCIYNNTITVVITYKITSVSQHQFTSYKGNGGKTPHILSSHTDDWLASHSTPNKGIESLLETMKFLAHLVYEEIKDMRWTGHVTNMGEMRNAYKILVENLKEIKKTYGT